MQLCNIQKILKNLVKQKSNIGGLKNRGWITTTTTTIN